MQFEGKVILITGASGGTGRATAEEFAAEGCHLALIGRHGFEGLASWCESRSWSDRATAISLDGG